MEKVDLNFDGVKYNIKETELAKISKENLRTITQFDLQNKREGLTEKTRYQNIYQSMYLAKHFQKPFKSITGEELLKFTDNLKIKDNTKFHYLLHIKKFMKWLYKSKNPKVIKELVLPNVKDKRKKFSEMLTEQEVQTLIDACSEVQHKALIALLYDSACRASEIINLNRLDVTCTGNQWVLSVDGKTGVRNVPLRIGCKYFIPWYNEYHPEKEDENAPLFISMSHFKKYEKVGEKRLSVCGLWYILQQVKKHTSIKKKIYPHLFRHSRLTWLGSHGMTEFDMRYFAGWDKDSTMPSVYVHVNPENMASKLNVLQGIATEQEKPQPTKLLGSICPKCNTENDVSSEYCKQCWLPMNFQASKREIMIMEFLRSVMYKSDETIVQDYSLETLSEKYNKSLKDQHKPGRKQVQVVAP